MVQYIHGTFFGAEQKETTFDFTYPELSKPLPVVIFCHGFKGFKDWGGFNFVAEQLALQEIAVFKINFSHNGTTVNDTDNFSDLESFSHNTLQMEMDDILCAESFIFQQMPKMIPGFEVGNLFLLGHSKGGVSCLLHAAHHVSSAKGIITWGTPFNFFRSWSEKFLKTWRIQGVQYVLNGRTKQQMPLSVSLLDDFEANRSRYDMKEALPKISQQVFIFHGIQDESVPYQDAAEIAKYCKQAHVECLEGANHTFGMTHPFDAQQVPSSLSAVIQKSIAAIKAV